MLKAYDRERKIVRYGLLVAAAILFAFVFGNKNILTKAAEYEFTLAPNQVYEIDEENTSASLNIEIDVNFNAKKWELYSDGVKVESNTINSSCFYVEIPSDKAGEEKIKNIRVYYGSGTSDYIETDGFTVSKKYMFIDQPSDKEVLDTSTYTTCPVYYKVNFTPVKIEVISDGAEKPVKTYNSGLGSDGTVEVPADYSNIKDGVKNKKLRVYYTKTAYIESNEFTVSKNCLFLYQPADKEIAENSIDTKVDVKYIVNFIPLKIEVISGDEQTVTDKKITGLSYSDVISVTADYANIVDGVQKKKLRVYYTSSNYIDSNEFTVIKNCKFITQPTDKEIDSSLVTTKISVGYQVNFKPLKIEVLSDNTVKKTLSSSLNYYGDIEVDADYANIENGIKNKKIRIYYTSTDYIDSNEFTVIKNCKFITQPTDKEIDGSSTATKISVRYQVNFQPLKIEILSDNTVKKTISSSLSYYGDIDVDADYTNIEGGVKNKKLRVYYTETDYVDSNEFKVTKTCEFINQPTNKEFEADSTRTTASERYYVNFEPVKIELLAGNDVVHAYTSNLSYYGDIDVVVENENDAIGKKIRAYYTSTDYIDSNEFKVIRLCGNFEYRILKQPESKEVQHTSLDSYCDVDYTLNFNPVKVEVISGNDVIQSYENINGYYGYDDTSFQIQGDFAGSSEGIKNKKLRFYYNDDQYIDSNEFTVIKSYDFIMQPVNTEIERMSNNTSINVNYVANFNPVKVELISDDEVIKSFENSNGYYSYNETGFSFEADFSESLEGVKSKKYRLYYNEDEYIESNPFTVTKTYEFIQQPENKEIERFSRETTCDVSYVANFNPVRVELVSDDIVKNTYDNSIGYYGYYSSSFLFTADITNSVEGIKSKKIRLYYNEEEFIESKEFTVTKTCEFIRQPQSVEIQRTSLDTYANVGYEVNINPVKLEIVYGDEVVKTYENADGYYSFYNNEYSITADIVGSVEGVKGRKYRCYYNEEEYIESDEFTVTKKCEIIYQPSSKEIQRVATTTSWNVNYELNFNPVIIEIWSGEDIINSYEISDIDNYATGSYSINADYIGSEAGVKDKFIRFYYGLDEEDYVDSAIFTVTKNPEMILQPESKILQRTSSDLEYSIGYEVNFIPVKIEVLADDEEENTYYFSYNYDRDKYDVKADVVKSLEDEVKLKKFRVYYTDEDYIDSDVFTVRKLCEFLKQPQSMQIERSSTDTLDEVKYMVNFAPKLIQLVAGDEVITEDNEYLYVNGTYTVEADYDNVESDVVGKKLRIFFDDSEDSYIESNEFTVTKHAEVLEGPADSYEIDRESVDESYDVPCAVNFNPVKVEIVSDDEIEKEIIDCYNSSLYTVKADPKEASDEDDEDTVYSQKKLRLYFADEEGCFVETEAFTVLKDYVFLISPASVKVDDESIDTGADVSWQTNFYPKQIYLFKGDKLVKSYTSKSYNYSWDEYYIPDYDSEYITADDDRNDIESWHICAFFEGGSIDSEEFTVTKHYDFLTQPEDYVIGLDSTATTYSEYFALNFVPVKVELISDDMPVDSSTGYRYSEGNFSISADPANLPLKKKLRAYYNNSATGYIDSDEFTVTKLYGFLAQPTSVVIDPDTTDTTARISWETSFIPKKIEIVSDNVIILDITNSLYYNDYSRYLTADPDTAPETKYIRAYYDAEGYVDSAEFTVTKHYHNLVLVPAKQATCTEEGNEEYYMCSLENCHRIYANATGTKRLAEIPVIDIDPEAHVWGDVEYVWADDNSTVTATRVCQLNAAHEETETVSTVITVENGLELYVAEFENPAFATLKKIKENIVTVPYGDANSDGKVDVRDVTALRRYLAGGWNVNISQENTDVNCDGKVDSKDLTILRRYLAGGWGIELPTVKNDNKGSVATAEINYFRDRLKIDDCYAGTISFSFNADGIGHTLNFDFFYEDDYNKSLGVSEDSFGEFVYAGNVTMLDLSNIESELVMETLLDPIYFDVLVMQFRNATAVKVNSADTFFVPDSGLYNYSEKSVTIINA